MITPKPLSAPTEFEQRSKRVQAEIEKRIAQKQPENPYAMRARLWSTWLAKNVLGEVSHA